MLKMFLKPSNFHLQIITFSDYVDRSIQYMALLISVTVCSIILGIIIVFCYIR